MQGHVADTQTISFLSGPSPPFEQGLHPRIGGAVRGDDGGGTSTRVERFEDVRLLYGAGVPFWYITVVERLAKSGNGNGRIFGKLFKRQSTTKDDRWDNKRFMNTIVQDDFLYRLITAPLVAMMRRLGLLDVVGSEEKREVDVCGSLLSKRRERRAESIFDLQGMHADMDAWFRWMRKFGFSVITAGNVCASKINLYYLIYFLLLYFVFIYIVV